MDVNDRRGGDGAIEGIDLVAAEDAAAMEEHGGGDDSSGGNSFANNSDFGSVDAESLLMQLRDNDPDLTAICLTEIASQVEELDWRQVGQDIGRNTNLELASFHHDTLTLNDYQALFKGMGQNESIRDLDFLRIDTFDGEIFRHLYLSPLIRRLHQLTIEDCNLGREGGMLLGWTLCGSDLFGHDPCGGGGSLIVSECPSSLQEINLDNIGTTERGMNTIIRSLRAHKNLEKISLRGSNIRDWGCKALAETLFLSNEERASLVALDLGENELAEEGKQGVNHLISAMLARRKSVSHLNLDDTDIAAPGWQEVAALIRQSKLKCLSLNDNRIEEEQMVDILEAVGSSDTLTDLHLDRTGVTLRGLEVLSGVLQSPESQLRAVSLCGGKIRNRGASLLAEALTHNNTLLRLDIENDVSITSRGWNAFVRMLCCKSSIMATYQSNHTLQQLQVDEWTLSGELMSLLLLNREDSRREVARRKVIKCHFSGKELDMQPFVDMPSGVLPHVIEWMARGGMSPLYLFVRNMQSYFDVKGGQGAPNAQPTTMSDI